MMRLCVLWAMPFRRQKRLPQNIRLIKISLFFSCRLSHYIWGLWGLRTRFKQGRIPNNLDIILLL